MAEVWNFLSSFLNSSIFLQCSIFFAAFISETELKQ
jgi:hypothetical protein